MAMENLHQQQVQLHRAIAAGEIDAAVAMIIAKRELLDLPYPPDIDSKQGTALHQALGSDNINMMRALLELNPETPNTLDNEGKTALARYSIDKINGYTDWMPFFIAVSKGCHIDPNSIRKTNEAAIEVLQKGTAYTTDINDHYLECLKRELGQFCDIELLPNRNKNPKAFCGMLLTSIAASNIAHSVNEGFFTNEMGAGMLEMIQKQGTNWEQNLHDLCKEDIAGIGGLASDTLVGFVTYSVLPDTIRRFGTKFNYHDGPLADGVRGDSPEPYPNVLFQNRSILECIDVIKAYHENMHRIDATLREIDEELLARTTNITPSGPKPEKGWIPLLPGGMTDVPQEVLAGQSLPDGAKKLILVELTDKKSLEDEASEEKQNNCVGSYGKECKSGKLRVFSVRTDTGSTLSTLGINIKKDGSFTQYQHYAKSNKAPHYTASLSARWLLRSLNDLSIPRNDIRPAHTQKGTTNEKLRPFLDFGFVPTEENCERGYALLAELKTAKGKPFLSPDHRYSTLAEMEENTGIVEQTANNIMFQKTDGYGKAMLDQLQKRVAALKAAGELPPPG